MIEYRYPSLEIAERIQKVFDDNNLTDKYVGDQIGHHRHCIMRYRNGDTNPSIKFIRWLCSEYEVDIAWLLDMKG